MKILAAVLGLGVLGAGLGLAGCSGAQPQAPPAAALSSSASPPAQTSPPAQSSSPARSSSPAQSSSPAPAVTKTVTEVKTASAPPAAGAPSTSAPASAATASTAPASTQAAPAAGPNVTAPWAVVSAYYGDIESGDYAQAYALIGNGSTTGQSYQQFAAGFACTGDQAVSENWQSGDEVNFDLAATDSCNGTTQYYSGTDTVENGTIVAADITAT
jgi:hypothetical protein